MEKRLKTTVLEGKGCVWRGVNMKNGHVCCHSVFAGVNFIVLGQLLKKPCLLHMLVLLLMCRQLFLNIATEV